MYNKLLTNKVRELQIKKSVTTVSADLKVAKSMVSSYLSGNIKASGPFLEKFSNFYEIPLIDITDPEEETDLQVPKKAISFEDEAVNYILDNPELKNTNPRFKVFFDLIVSQAKVEVLERLQKN